MNRLKLIQRVRSMTRDFTNATFRENDIIDFINEGINRFKQIIPEVKKEELLLSNQQKLKYIPEEFQELLVIYSTSRCFSQDERHYQATTLMNEFEVKLDELREAIDNGIHNILDPDTGEVITMDLEVEYVDLYPYWGIKS